jgi:hypothetical protein
MLHKKNLDSFLAVADGEDPLLCCYCGLVALELVIKHEVGLIDHNVIHGLNRFGISKAIDKFSWARPKLAQLASKLRTDLVAIYANGIDGNPRNIPAESYPYLRYCRLEDDGWGAPCATDEQLVTLSKTIRQIRTFLRSNFSLSI